MLQQFSEVFDDQPGMIRGFKAVLHVQPEASIKFNRPRPVPFVLRTEVEQELERLQNLGILERVITSSWAAPKLYQNEEEGCVSAVITRFQ